MTGIRQAPWRDNPSVAPSVTVRTARYRVLKSGPTGHEEAVHRSLRSLAIDATIYTYTPPVDTVPQG